MKIFEDVIPQKLNSETREVEYVLERARRDRLGRERVAAQVAERGEAEAAEPAVRVGHGGLGRRAERVGAGRRAKRVAARCRAERVVPF